MAAAVGAVIAASVAIASAGAGMVMSFDAASKAKKKEARALAEVKNKMSEARRKLETNYQPEHKLLRQVLKAKEVELLQQVGF